MGKVYTEAQKIGKLRNDLATRALHVVKAKYMDEYQEVYYGLLAEHGLQPTNRTMHMHILWQENKRLKEVLKAMAAKGSVEVIEFEEDR